MMMVCVGVAFYNTLNRHSIRRHENVNPPVPKKKSFHCAHTFSIFLSKKDVYINLTPLPSPSVMFVLLFCVCVGCHIAFEKHKNVQHAKFPITPHHCSYVSFPPTQTNNTHQQQTVGCIGKMGCSSIRHSTND
mmetsp:Transcript_43558/g.52230  ORF Transcript_43558/g.52230 Transcript_43558/m.52230 type:complete len:133 (-) Transcript_43558:362-760(-)